MLRSQLSIIPTGDKGRRWLAMGTEEGTGASCEQALLILRCPRYSQVGIKVCAQVWLQHVKVQRVTRARGGDRRSRTRAWDKQSTLPC